MNDSEKLANYIEQWRQAQRGLSRSALLKKAGLGGTWLTQLERGADVQIGSVARIAEAMGMTLGELIDNAGLGREDEDARPDIVELIRTDPGLLPEARRHLISQYGLLLRVHDVSPAQDAGPKGGPGLRAVARKRGDRKSDAT